MTSILHGGTLQTMDQSKMHPLRTWVIISLLLSIVLYRVIQDFRRTYLKRPPHFSPRTWSDFWYKPNAAVPLMQVDQNGSYEDALARGAQLVCMESFPFPETGLSWVFQYPDSPYKISHFPHEIVILPHKWMDMIKNSTPNDLSFQQCSYDLLVGDFTGISANQADLTRLLQREIILLQDRMQNEVGREGTKGLDDVIGPCEGMRRSIRHY